MQSVTTICKLDEVGDRYGPKVTQRKAYGRLVKAVGMTGLVLSWLVLERHIQALNLILQVLL